MTAMLQFGTLIGVFIAAVVAVVLWAFFTSEEGGFWTRLVYALATICPVIPVALIVGMWPPSGTTPARAIGLVLLLGVLLFAREPPIDLGTSSIARTVIHGLAFGTVEGVAVGLLAGPVLA